MQGAISATNSSLSMVKQQNSALQDKMAALDQQYEALQTQLKE